MVESVGRYSIWQFSAGEKKMRRRDRREVRDQVMDVVKTHNDEDGFYHGVISLCELRANMVLSLLLQHHCPPVTGLEELLVVAEMTSNRPRLLVTLCSPPSFPVTGYLALT
jgi:hypothetical protein